MSVASSFFWLEPYLIVGPTKKVTFLAMGMETLGVKEYCSCLALKKSEFWSPPSEVSLPKPKKRFDSTPEA